VQHTQPVNAAGSGAAPVTFCSDRVNISVTKAQEIDIEVRDLKTCSDSMNHIGLLETFWFFGIECAWKHR
jgi:hypothetical protein